MRFDRSGLLRLKPFDESEDAAKAGSIYATSAVLTIGVVTSAVLALVALLLALTKNDVALLMLAVATAASGITAGFEWNAGLRARALNQLFCTVVAVSAVAVLN